jgi:hypothetical protein
MVISNHHFAWNKGKLVGQKQESQGQVLQCHICTIQDLTLTDVAVTLCQLYSFML